MGVGAHRGYQDPLGRGEDGFRWEGGWRRVKMLRRYVLWSLSSPQARKYIAFIYFQGQFSL